MVATSIGVDEVWEWWLVRWKNCLFVDYCNEIHHFDVNIEFFNNHNCDDDVNIECLLGLKSSVWERLTIDLMSLNRWFELMILWSERIVLFVDYCNEIHNFDVDIEFCNNLGLKSSVWERLSIDLMPLNRWFELMILIDVKWFVENFDHLCLWESSILISI